MMLQESNWHLEIRANWPRLSAILFEQKKILSNCSKQLVTPVNSRIIQFPGLGARSESQKTAFYRGHFSHCALSRFFSYIDISES